jgi:Surface-adhesin protein E
MSPPSTRHALCLLLIAVAALSGKEAHGEDWIYYAGSRPDLSLESTLKDPYIANRLEPVSEAEAAARHFYDLESVAEGTPGAGGIVRVWEKYVLEKETKSYEETKAEIEREEESKLKRKLTAMDQSWIFPLAVTRATKEIWTLYEINCGSGDFIVLEVNQYDREGNRMTRETNFAREVWYPIQPDTVMQVLSETICRQ